MDIVSSARRAGRPVLLGSATLIGRMRRAPAADPERLRILAHVPNYPPGASAGSERSIESILEWLHGRGHAVTVLFDGDAVEGDRAGVRIIRERSMRSTVKHYRAHDVVLTQLGTRNKAMGFARLTRRPLVHFVRMGRIDRDTAFGIPDLLVFNAAWLREATPWPGATGVVHPPVQPERYRTTPGDAITLVNLNANKGAGLFFTLAERLAGRVFVGVTGDYGDQVDPAEAPPNVTLLAPVDDVREIYRRTRLLLMPSRHESYGRVSLEAAASGIPTIGSLAPGIREALGDAGTYVDRDDVDGWIDAIRHLDEPEAYAAASARALARSGAVVPEAELARFEAQLQGLVPSRRPAKESAPS